MLLSHCGRRRSLHLCVPFVSMASQLLWLELAAFGMGVVIVVHLGVAFKAKRNTVIGVVRSTLANGDDVIRFDFYAARLVANTAAAPAGDQCVLYDPFRKSHLGL